MNPKLICTGTQKIVPLILVEKDADGLPIWKQIGWTVAQDSRVDNIKAMY